MRKRIKERGSPKLTYANCFRRDMAERVIAYSMELSETERLEYLEAVYHRFHRVKRMVKNLDDHSTAIFVLVMICPADWISWNYKYLSIAIFGGFISAFLVLSENLERNLRILEAVKLGLSEESENEN